VRVLVIAGVDHTRPYIGRTDALALVIYHPRLARASLVSIPPDLIGYIPGYTMQRMNTAYAVGGARRLQSALEYNFGLRPTTYAILNLDDFQSLIDDLGGINVTILEELSSFCPDIPHGLTLLNGAQALCYMRLRVGEDEQARNRRQQEILRTVFLRLVEGGNLVRVSDLYARHRSSVDTNLTLDDFQQSIPLALKLGDPARIGYFQLSEKQLNLWQISQHPRLNVFLPNRPALMVLMQQAINFVTTPSPLQDIVITLEYQLTISPTPTSTYTITPTPTDTPTPRPPITPTYTVTPTGIITNTFTVTPTRTVTPTQTVTPSRTP
jgi:LCP family protein required for cell wall assembly